MSTDRKVKIVIGLALIGYAIYSGIAWFYLGVIPLILGTVNWCPLKMKIGACDSTTGCCASSNSNETKGSSCCSSEDTEKSESACCTPKKEDQTTSATHISSFQAVAPSKNGTTVIEILGTGCSKCIALEKVVNEAIKSLDGDYEVKKVSNVEEIMAYKVVSTPGLVINGTVVSTGKVLTIDEIKNMLHA